MIARGCELLAQRASVVADWADRMPLRDVYIFGDHAVRRRRGGRQIEDRNRVQQRRQRRDDEGLAAREFHRLRRAATGARHRRSHSIQTRTMTCGRPSGTRYAPLMTIRKVRVVQTPAPRHPARRYGARARIAPGLKGSRGYVRGTSGRRQPRRKRRWARRRLRERLARIATLLQMVLEEAGQRRLPVLRMR